MIKQFKTAGAHILRYFFLSFLLITGVLLWLFIQATPQADNMVAFVYRMTIPLYYFFALLVIVRLLTPLYFIKGIKYLILLPKILFDVFLLADYFVFKIYRFHIDMMFVKMAISDFKGIGISPFMSVVSVLAVLFIAWANYKIFVWTKNMKIKRLKLAKWLLLGFLIWGQLTHIWANYYKQHFIEQYTPYFPYYFPTTSHSLMKKLTKKYAFLIPNPIEKASQDLQIVNKQKGQGLLDYPKKALQFTDSISKPNILLVVLESWRTDFLSPEATPALDSLANHSYRFNKHYSGGNVTVSGIFSLMFGLHPTYLSYVQADAYAHQSELLKGLKKQAYDVKAYTSSNLDRFSLKAMIFNKIAKENYINITSGSADKADRKVVDKLLADIQTEKQQPWFKFVFLTSSHHHYNYPEKYKIFTPLPSNSEGFIFDKNVDATPFINDYKNALRYEDALLSEVLTSLKKSGKYDNTVIIITGDHGEEFNDNQQAYWGHGSNFTKYQTSVPLIVHDPRQNQGKVINHSSGHIDVAPTILQRYLGCTNPLTDYSSGKNLFDTIRHTGFLMTSYKDKAYLIDDKIYATGLFVRSYSVDDIKSINKDYNYKALNLLRKEESAFLKRK